MSPLSPENAFQLALVAALKADAGVTALIDKRVFDETPADPRPPTPYSYIGPLGASRVEMGAVADEPDSLTDAFTARARLYVISTAFGRTEAWSIAHAIRKALRFQTLVLAAPYEMVEEVRIIAAGDVLDPLTPRSVFVDAVTTIQEIMP